MRVPDHFDFWDAHDRTQVKAEKELPTCYECEHPIQDEYCFEINGEYVCPDCLKANHRKEVESLCEF